MNNVDTIFNDNSLRDAIFGILIHRLGGSVSIAEEDFEAIAGGSLVFTKNEDNDVLTITLKKRSY